MARPNEKLADALKALKMQDKHSGVIESNDLKEKHTDPYWWKKVFCAQ